MPERKAKRYPAEKVKAKAMVEAACSGALLGPFDRCGLNPGVDVPDANDIRKKSLLTYLESVIHEAEIQSCVLAGLFFP